MLGFPFLGGELSREERDGLGRWGRSVGEDAGATYSSIGSGVATPKNEVIASHELRSRDGSGFGFGLGVGGSTSISAAGSGRDSTAGSEVVDLGG